MGIKIYAFREPGNRLHVAVEMTRSSDESWQKLQKTCTYSATMSAIMNASGFGLS